MNPAVHDFRQGRSYYRAGFNALTSAAAAARQDAYGYYYIVDRWKDMYISGGENVYPGEGERVLACMPGISEVTVVGQPDLRWGEVGEAFVVLAPADRNRHGDEERVAALESAWPGLN